MREIKLPYQTIKCAGLFQRIEVFALNVFDERHRNGRLIRNVAYYGRYVGKTRHLRGTPPALARDDLVSLNPVFLADGSGNDRLHYALRFNRLRQLFE